MASVCDMYLAFVRKAFWPLSSHGRWQTLIGDGQPTHVCVPVRVHICVCPVSSCLSQCLDMCVFACLGIHTSIHTVLHKNKRYFFGETARSQSSEIHFLNFCIIRAAKMWIFRKHEFSGSKMKFDLHKFKLCERNTKRGFARSSKISGEWLRCVG